MNSTPGLRAAIYARYSSDKQKDTSAAQGRLHDLRQFAPTYPILLESLFLI